jgi:hypothetical protein
VGEQLAARKKELMAEFQGDGVPAPVTVTMTAPPPEHRRPAA